MDRSSPTAKHNLGIASWPTTVKTMSTMITIGAQLKIFWLRFAKRWKTTLPNPIPDNTATSVAVKE
jgi:hypothetical protein